MGQNCCCNDSEQAANQTPKISKMKEISDDRSQTEESPKIFLTQQSIYDREGPTMTTGHSTKELSFDSYASPAGGSYTLTRQRFSWSQESLLPTPNANQQYRGTTPLNADMLRGSTLRKFNFYLQIDEQPTEEAAIDIDQLQIGDNEAIFKNRAGNSDRAQAYNLDSRSGSFIDTTTVPLLNSIQQRPSMLGRRT